MHVSVSCGLTRGGTIEYDACCIEGPVSVNIEQTSYSHHQDAYSYDGELATYTCIGKQWVELARISHLQLVL